MNGVCLQSSNPIALLRNIIQVVYNLFACVRKVERNTSTDSDKNNQHCQIYQFSILMCLVHELILVGPANCQSAIVAAFIKQWIFGIVLISPSQYL